MVIVRKTNQNDREKIYLLYKKTASIVGGLARIEVEITDEYISSFVTQSIDRGLSLIVELDKNIIGEIHAYRPKLQVFSHMISELTICIYPDYQGQRYGINGISSKLENDIPRLVERVVKSYSLELSLSLNNFGLKEPIKISINNGREFEIPTSSSLANLSKNA